jgi:hypothetical protein
MVTAAQNTFMTLVASASGAVPGGPAEPVPAAFLGRTSTMEMQDPRASLRRQVRAAQESLPAGFRIVAWYWDIESGALDLKDRSQGQAHCPKVFGFMGSGVWFPGSGYGLAACRSRRRDGMRWSLK